MRIHSSLLKHISRRISSVMAFFIIGVMLTVPVTRAGEPRRITTAQTDDDEPCFSPYGRWIVYQSRNVSGKPDLLLIDANGGTPKRITQGPGYNCFPTWSPDGRRIVYASDPDGEYDLFCIEREKDGWSAPKRLTNTPGVREYLPAFSPDGKRIAFTAALPTGSRLGDNSVFIMNADGEEPVKRPGQGTEGRSVLMDVVGRELVVSDHGAVEPSWSRDGKTISYSWHYLVDTAGRRLFDEGHQMGVSLIAAAAPTTRASTTQELKQLHGYASYGAAFSPTADVLALVLSRGEAWDIWLLPAPYTGQPIRLTHDPANDVNPCWSPDGKRIAFASNRTGNYDIFVMDVSKNVLPGAPQESKAAALQKVRVILCGQRNVPGAHGSARFLPIANPHKKSSTSKTIQRDWQQLITAGEASWDSHDRTKWTVAAKPPVGKGLLVEPGAMICADVQHRVKDFTYDPKLVGWHKVLVGLYLPPGITYTGVAAKLSQQRAFTCVADPRASLVDRGKGFASFLDADFVELPLAQADLTGRRIVVHHPEGCRSYLTHFRFLPMTDAEIAAAKAVADKKPIDVHLWVDIMSYEGLAERPENDWWENSPRAVHRFVRYFCDYGANCMGYRALAGGRARYNSKVLHGERERYIDKRIGMDMRIPWGKHRYGDIDVDLLSEWVRASHFYGKKAFAVWAWEESHGYPVFLESFNVEHPKFMSRYKDGTYQLACASLAYREVVDHKLAIAQELIDHGVDGIMFDFQRIWGWYQTRNMTDHHQGIGGWDKGFVPPAIAEYQKLFGVDPRTEEDNNRRWIEFSTHYITNFFREFKKLCDRSGRNIEIVMTVPAVSKDPYTAVRAYGCDWETWVAEGLISGLSPLIPPTAVDGRKQKLEDVIDIMQYVQKKCDGKCEVIWPLSYYKRTVAGLANNSGLSLPEYTERILDQVRRHHAAGVNLTTVDYNMGGLNIDTLMRVRNGNNPAIIDIK